MDTPRYAAIYARVSTDEQVKGYSIPTQIEACRKLADRQGYMVPDGYVLIDEGISGTTMERPGLRQLRELIRSRAIQATIIYDLDRLSRKHGHQLLLLEEWERAEVALLVASSPIDASPEGALLLHVKGAMAEYERAKILERTRRGRLGRAKAGHPLGGGVPFGYCYISEPHKGTYVVDESEAAVVRRIFDLCLQGLTMRSIARKLTEERVLTAWDRHPERGRAKKVSIGEWAQGTVHRILTNTAYTGTTHFDKSRTISRELVQRNSALSFRHGRQANAYLLRGRWFRCGRCGRTMTGFTVRTRRYYRCTSSAVELDPARRCRGSVRANDIEARVWTAILEALDNPELIAAEVAKLQATMHEQEAAIDQEVEAMDLALAKCDREERLWAEAYAKEAISVTELKAYRTEIGDRRREWERQRRECEQRREAMQKAVDQVESLVEYCRQVRSQLGTFSLDEQQRAFDALALKVYWTPGEEKDVRLEASIPLDSNASQPGRWHC